MQRLLQTKIENYPARIKKTTNKLISEAENIFLNVNLGITTQHYL